MRNTHNRKALVTKLTFIPGLFALLTTTIFGMWAPIPLDELVMESDLIVVGTLHFAIEDSEGVGRGYIRVENIVAGNAVSLDKRPLAIGDSLNIKWADNWACAMGMHMRRRNQVGVWLLDVEKDGSVSAAYPGKFESMDQLAEIRRLLRKGKAKKRVAVDVYLDQPPPAVAPDQKTEVFAVDLSPSPDHSVERAGITLLFAMGLYWLLYRSRFRIR